MKCVYATGAHDYPALDDRCDGEVTVGPDPYLRELEGDETEVPMCEHHRQERRDDV